MKYISITLSIIFVGILFVVQGCEQQEEKIMPTPSVFSTSSDNIIVDGETLDVRGVVYVPFAPGYLPWDFEYDTQLPDVLINRINDDIDSINAMGVNTIRLWGAPRYCYDRIAKKTDILILQTIWLDGEHADFSSSDFISSSKAIIDEVTEKIFSAISSDNPPILAYLIGNELSRQSILNTNQTHPEKYAFTGEYIQTDTSLSATELTLAELADYLKKVVVSYTSVEPLVSYSNELRTYDILDTPFLDFRSYNVYSYAVDYYIADPPTGSSSGTITQGFIEQLKNAHPEIPLLVTETGLSVNPGGQHLGPPNYGYGGNSENEQATGLLQTIVDIETASPPIAGVIIHEFNDAWWKFGLEDSYSQDPDDIEEWFGLVAFTGEPSAWNIIPREAYHDIRDHWSE